MTIADLARWHATALRARFGEPVDVMGISGGGVTALQLALDHPGTVRRLVLAAFGLSRSRARAPGEAALIEAGQTWDVTGRLGELSVPVLVIGGTRDRIVPPETVRATASAIPGARLPLLPGRGHLTALWDPRAKPAIAAFLAEPA